MLFAKNTNDVLTISQMERNETVIIIDSQTHIDYGLAYPVTYEFSIPDGSNNLKTYRKFKSNQPWSLVTEKTNHDFFNGIDAKSSVRKLESAPPYLPMGVRIPSHK